MILGLNMKKLAKNWKARLIKSYSSLSILANIFVAISISGLSVLGVISNAIALPLLIALAITFGVVGLFGRVIDQGLDDVSEEVKTKEDEE